MPEMIPDCVFLYTSCTYVKSLRVALVGASDAFLQYSTGVARDRAVRGGRLSPAWIRALWTFWRLPDYVFLQRPSQYALLFFLAFGVLSHAHELCLLCLQ